MADPRYPVGSMTIPQQVSPADITAWIDELAALPVNLRAAVSGITETELNTPYRDGGWTVRQVVHHIADSHINAVVRVKLALTEDEPTVKTYNEVLWAELADMNGPIEPSVMLLDGLHARWANLMRSLSEAQMHRTFHHPDWGLVRVDQYLALYAWHSRHHVAHVNVGRKRAQGNVARTS
jgi:hypothetical protein